MYISLDWYLFCPCGATLSGCIVIVHCRPGAGSSAQSTNQTLMRNMRSDLEAVAKVPKSSTTRCSCGVRCVTRSKAHAHRYTAITYVIHRNYQQVEQGRGPGAAELRTGHSLREKREVGEGGKGIDLTDKRKLYCESTFAIAASRRN